MSTVKSKSQQQQKSKRMQRKTVSTSAAQAATPAVVESGLSQPIDSMAQLSPADLSDLQRTYGNRFMQRFSQPAAQPVHRAPSSPSISGGDASGGGGTVHPNIEQKIEGMRGRGMPLPDNLQGQLENMLGANLNHVRVHANGAAGQLAKSLGAEAFTTKSDIFFANNKFNPNSKQGQKLLAHEVTHVIQQGAATPHKKKPASETPAADTRSQQASGHAHHDVKSAHEMVKNVNLPQLTNELRGAPPVPNTSGLTNVAGQTPAAEGAIKPVLAPIKGAEAPTQGAPRGKQTHSKSNTKQAKTDTKSKATSNAGNGKQTHSKNKQTGGSATGKASDDKEQGEPQTEQYITPAPGTAVGAADAHIPTMDTASLPSWNQLAEGSISMKGAVSKAQKELRHSGTLSINAGNFQNQQGGAQGMQANADPQSATWSIIGNSIEQGLMQGFTGAVSSFATSFIKDNSEQLVGTLLNVEMPYVDGVSELLGPIWSSLGSDKYKKGPNKGKEKGFGTKLYDNTLGTVGSSFSDIGSKFTAITSATGFWGHLAAVFEFLDSIISAITSVTGLLTKGLKILAAFFYLLSIIPINPAAPFFAVLATDITSGLLPPIDSFNSILGKISTVFGTISKIARIVDFLSSWGDPKAMLTKQAAFTAAIQGMSSSLTNKGIGKLKSKTSEFAKEHGVEGPVAKFKKTMAKHRLKKAHEKLQTLEDKKYTRSKVTVVGATPYGPIYDIKQYKPSKQEKDHLIRLQKAKIERHEETYKKVYGVSYKERLETKIELAKERMRNLQSPKYKGGDVEIHAYSAAGHAGVSVRHISKQERLRQTNATLKRHEKNLKKYYPEKEEDLSIGESDPTKPRKRAESDLSFGMNARPGQLKLDQVSTPSPSKQAASEKLSLSDETDKLSTTEKKKISTPFKFTDDPDKKFSRDTYKELKSKADIKRYKQNRDKKVQKTAKELKDKQKALEKQIDALDETKDKEYNPVKQKIARDLRRTKRQLALHQRKYVKNDDDKLTGNERIFRDPKYFKRIGENIATKWDGMKNKYKGVKEKYLNPDKLADEQIKMRNLAAKARVNALTAPTEEKKQAHEKILANAEAEDKRLKSIITARESLDKQQDRAKKARSKAYLSAEQRMEHETEADRNVTHAKLKLKLAIKGESDDDDAKELKKRIEIHDAIGKTFKAHQKADPESRADTKTALVKAQRNLKLYKRGIKDDATVKQAHEVHDELYKAKNSGDSARLYAARLAFARFYSEQAARKSPKFSKYANNALTLYNKNLKNFGAATAQKWLSNQITSGLSKLLLKPKIRFIVDPNTLNTPYTGIHFSNQRLDLANLPDLSNRLIELPNTDPSKVQTKDNYPQQYTLYLPPSNNKEFTKSLKVTVDGDEQKAKQFSEGNFDAPNGSKIARRTLTIKSPTDGAEQNVTLKYDPATVSSVQRKKEAGARASGLIQRSADGSGDDDSSDTNGYTLGETVSTDSSADNSFSFENSFPDELFDTEGFASQDDYALFDTSDESAHYDESSTAEAMSPDSKVTANLTEDAAETAAEQAENSSLAFESADDLNLETEDSQGPDAASKPKLPPPPYHVFNQVTVASAKYDVLKAKEAETLANMAEAREQKKYSDAQQEDLASGHKIIGANQKALSVHQQDIEDKSKAQDQAKATSTQAEKPAAEGGVQAQIGQAIMSAITPLITSIMGTGAKHTHIGDGAGQAAKTAQGSKGVADSSKNASGNVTQGQSIIDGHKQQTHQARGESIGLQKQLGTLSASTESDLDLATSSSNQLEAIHSQQAEDLQSLRSQQDDVQATYEESVNETGAWADEHQAIRLTIYGDLEAE